MLNIHANAWVNPVTGNFNNKPSMYEKEKYESATLWGHAVLLYNVIEK